MTVTRPSVLLTRAQQYLVFAAFTIAFWIACLKHVEIFPAPTRFFVQIVLWLPTG